MDKMLSRERAVDFELKARNTRDKNFNREFDTIFKNPKSIFEGDVTMNGSYNLVVSCAEMMVNESNGSEFHGEAGRLPIGVCCSDEEWIGATIDA